MPHKEHYIAHVDMDAFFASVEQRDNTDFRGKPVIVGSDPKGGAGRGVVAACSYEARKYGIHSAMPISRAYKTCPHGIFVTPDMDRYHEASVDIFGIMETFTPDIEPISVDEAFLDITGSHHLFGGPIETCKKIKQRIKQETGLTASIGLAPNKMTAKIASDIKKPDGLVVVDPIDLLTFLHPLPISKIWGIGAKTEKVFHSLGIFTVGDLAVKDSDEIEHTLGKHGRHVWELANGIDDRDVVARDEAKSIGNEHTFDQDTNDMEDIQDVLMYLSEKVSRRLRRAGLKTKTITLKIRFSDFKTYTRAETLPATTNFTEDLYRISVEKLRTFKLEGTAIRLLGVKASGLQCTDEEFDFFGESNKSTDKKERIHKALDKIKNKFGERSVGRRRI